MGIFTHAYAYVIMEYVLIGTQGMKRDTHFSGKTVYQSTLSFLPMCYFHSTRFTFFILLFNSWVTQMTHS